MGFGLFVADMNLESVQAFLRFGLAFFFFKFVAALDFIPVKFLLLY